MVRICFKTIIIIGVIVSINTCNNKREASTNLPLNQTSGLTTGTALEVAMSAKGIGSAEKLFMDAVEQGKVLGYQLVVARRGKVILDVAGGSRDLEKQLPMDRNTLLRMASNTKSITAVGVLTLLDQGLISLDDPIGNYLSGFEESLSSKITIKQLLTHTSGYTDFAPFAGDIFLDEDGEPANPDLIREATKLGKLGPEIEPGTFYRYNNRGYNILAALIEKVSGKKLESYIKETIFEPLEMSQTSYRVWGVDSTRMANQYWIAEGHWEKLDVWDVEFPRGSAGINSTAQDWAKFGQMLLNNGVYNGHRILEEQTVKEARSAIIDVPEAYLPLEIEQEMGFESEWFEYRDKRDLGLDISRGYGFVVSNEGVFSHAGIFGTFMYVDPKRELVGVILTQSIYGGNPGQAFIEAINAAILDYP